MRRQALSLVRGILRTAATDAGPNASNTTTSTAIGVVALRRGFADDASLLKTPLYDYHVENGGM